MARLRKPDDTWQVRANACMAQRAPGTNSKRADQYVEGVYPTHLTHGKSCYVYDFAGNRYIDFVCGLGSSILGYSHPAVVEAVRKQIERGASLSLPSTLEVEVAEMIQQLFPIAKRVRFLKTGSEACAAAVRIARAHTNKYTVESEGYHGHNDLFVSLTPPAHGVRDQFNIVPLDLSKDYPHTACVILEPVCLSLSPDRQSYLKDVTDRANQAGALVIFDEIITGCRVPKMSIAKMWSMKPDILVLGKAVANGFPLSIVAGSEDVMNSTEYFISSTFSGDCVSLAACKATLTELSSRDVDELMFYGERIRSKLNALDADIQFEGYGTRAMLNTTNPKTALFMQECCKAGILFGKAWFFNWAHLEENIEEIVMNVASDAAAKIQRGDVKLEGKLPKETFKR